MSGNQPTLLQPPSPRARESLGIQAFNPHLFHSLQPPFPPESWRETRCLASQRPPAPDTWKLPFSSPPHTLGTFHPPPPPTHLPGENPLL